MPTPALAVLSFVLLPFAAPTPQERAGGGAPIPFTKETLQNGLQVFVHEDHSDPVVSIYVSYHVGSGREEQGRSGFAHLFEHMLFQGSQHVGDDQHFKMISEAGGTLNGTTNTDRTLYFETLPSNHLELALWLEADRMGFVLPAVTQAALDNQREVVKNERRQNYENRPYAQAEGAIIAALFPPDHPYSWTTIGSHADLSAASLEDVHAFFRRWYGPNNATLAIGGDVKTADVMALVKRYFGSIPRGPAVEKPKVRPAVVEQSQRLVLEDNVKLPQLIVTWPAAERGHADTPALNVLASALALGRSSVLERAFRLDEALARSVSASNDDQEIAGTFSVTITAAPGVSLDKIETRLAEVLAKVDKEGVADETLTRLKTRAEVGYLRRLETVGGKTGMLANSNSLTGDPNNALADLQALLAVKPAQVSAVLRKYVLGKPSITMSVVPKGKIEMAASGRTSEQIAAETSFDRSKRPAAGTRPAPHAPAVWHDKLANGVKVAGNASPEAPFLSLSLSVAGGHRSETVDTLGVASLTASMLNEGTKRLSTTELSEALDALGATLNANADDDSITLTLDVLQRNAPAAIAILEEVLLEPRFAAKDFERLRKQRLTAIDTRGENIGGIARAAWSRLNFGDRSMDGLPAMGTRATVEKLTLEDVKSFWKRVANPADAKLAVVGNVDAAGIRQLVGSIVTRWKSDAAPIAANASATRETASSARPGIYLVDKPGASQSELRVGHMSVATTDADHYPLMVLNFVLGGAFSSRINMNLREAKGYTYGARSGFEGGTQPAPFAASGGFHTQFTKESLVEVRAELKKVLDGITDEELAFARSSLAQSAALRYESPQARLGMLREIHRYGFADDYAAQQLRRLEGLTTAELKTLAQKHLRPDATIYLVVGDKATVLPGLLELAKEWGFDGVTELDIDGAVKK